MLQNYESKVLAEVLPITPFKLLPLNVQNLICLSPVVTNSSYDFHAIEVAFALSTADVTTKILDYQS